MTRVLGIVVLSIIAPVFATEAAAKSAFAEIFEHYEAIRQELIGSSTTHVAGHASAIEGIASGLVEDFSTEGAGVAGDSSAAVRDLLPEVVEQAGKLADARGLDPIRTAFADLSKPLVRWHGMVEENRPVVVYCPMVKRPWLQPDEAVGNPYAPSMLRCGEVVAR
jgi:hypothetical protein